ncbi:MAG: 3-isopropylmalate dehydrogenase [Mycoplasmatales bacterium]
MKKIVCLKGDGVGKELIDLSVEFMNKIADKLENEYSLITTSFGGAAIDEYGDPFPTVVKELLVSADAVLLGAVGHPDYDDQPRRPETGLLEIRKHLGLFANIRGLTVNESTAKYSPLKREIVTGTDLIIVRELIGGAYFGEKTLNDSFARDCMDYTVEQIEQVARIAFEFAKMRNNRLLSVDKANVLSTSKLWRKVVIEMSHDYPEVELTHMYVDAFAMELLKNPTKYDVVVTENLFGDILTDELAAVGGSLGLLPSASVNNQSFGLYEPAHGSAPTIAGLDLVNPVAMLLSITLMLKVQFKEEYATVIEQAIQKNLTTGFVTKDLCAKTGVNTSVFMEKIYEELGV